MKTVDIEKVKDVDVRIDFEKIIKKYSDMSVTRLKQKSPDSGRNRPTPYKEGWEVKDNVYRHGVRHIVWNRTNWQLTHLLENGHFITTKINGVGWASSQPHILPVFRQIEPKFIRAMRKAKTTIKIK